MEICPSATLVPLVAMSLGLAGEALAAAGREISAPVHVDSSFAARGDPPGSDGEGRDSRDSQDSRDSRESQDTEPHRVPLPPARHGDTSDTPVDTPGLMEGLGFVLDSTGSRGESSQNKL